MKTILDTCKEQTHEIMQVNMIVGCLDSDFIGNRGDQNLVRRFVFFLFFCEEDCRIIM